MIEKFVMKQEHLKLLKNMYVDWDDIEFGAPNIDPKRPYGNSNVFKDMIEILGLNKNNGVVFRGKKYRFDLENDDYPNELCDALLKLHVETKTALQISLSRQKFETGVYERKDYGNVWVKVL